MNNVIECRQDAHSTVSPADWMCMQIFGWECTGFSSERAVIRHTQDATVSFSDIPGMIACAVELEASFDETFHD